MFRPATDVTGTALALRGDMHRTLFAILDFGVGWVVSLGAILGLFAGGLSAVLVDAGGIDRSLSAPRIGTRRAESS